MQCLKNIENNGTTTKAINIKSHGENINLHIPIMKLLNAGKTMLKKDSEFDQVFNIFDEWDKNCKLVIIAKTDAFANFTSWHKF